MRHPWFEETEQQALSPSCDVEETDTHFLMSLDLPGVKKDDVKIELRNNQLTISGERKEEHREKSKKRINEEIFHGTFMRSFPLPDSVKEDRVEASFENGVLKVIIPKLEESKPKQILINEGPLRERKTA